MPRTTFKCSKCGRTFSMRAHLARHSSAIHGVTVGRARIAARGRTVKRRVGRPKGSRSRIVARPKKNVRRRAQSVGDASARLIGEMHAYHGNLLAQRSSLDGRIDALTNAMKALGAAVGVKPRRRTGKRGRPAGSGIRAGSLKDYIVRVLRQTTKPMSPREISARTIKAGFKTHAKDVTKAVSNKLAELNNVKRVSFGLYRLVGG